MWITMIVLHTLAGVVGVVAGLVLWSPDRARRQRHVSSVFVGSIVALVVFMVAATISHWDAITTGERITFSALSVLGLYMVYRAWRARRQVRAVPLAAGRYFDDVGFVLIALSDGFVIVLAIDLGAPVWLVVLAAIVPIAAGHHVIGRAKEDRPR